MSGNVFRVILDARNGRLSSVISETPYLETIECPANVFESPDDYRFVNGEFICIANDPENIRQIKANLLGMLPHWENSERVAGIEYAGYRWLTTPLALQDIRDVLLAGAVPGEQWVTADRQIVPMTLAGLQSLWQAITARGAQIYQRRLEMEQQIADMSREQLEAFVPGWPEGSM